MIIDIFFLLFFAWGAFKGFKKGLIIAIFSFLSLIIGVIGALKLTHITSIYFQQTTHIDSIYTPFITFLFLLIVIIVLINLLGKLLTKMLSIVALDLINKLAGAILLASIYIFIYSSILWFLNQVNLINPSTKLESTTFYLLEPLAANIIEFLGQILPMIKNSFIELETLFEDLATKTAPI